MRARRTLAAMVAVLGLAAACSSDDSGEAGAAGEISDDVASGGSEEGEALADASRGEPSSAGGGGGDSASPAVPTPADDVAPEQEQLGLQAGSVDDNDAWDDYLRYREDFLASGIPVEDLDVEGRRLVRVVDVDGVPVLDALVVVTDESGAEIGRARTAADGRVVVFAPVAGSQGSANQSRPRLDASIDHAGTHLDVALDPSLDAQDVTLPGDHRRAAVTLDLHFLIDATGSMGDEIERLKANMISVAERVAELPGAPDVRFSLTAYRDVGDEYVTRTTDFTADVDEFTSSLAQIVADGGGDDPEALNEALAEMVAAPSWRTGDVVRLSILVADAPPQLGRQPAYLSSVAAARELGIKILPIASSGTPDQAEFVFRQLAQQTLGRFTFLTYGADGASPGTDTDLHVDEYDVLSLDDLVVQLVADELDQG